MLKTEFIEGVTQIYSVDVSEPFYEELDRMADRALAMHKDSDRWDMVKTYDEYPMQLIVGSMIHYSRASGSAKVDFPIESQEGSLDKSARYRNNIGMALALKAEYIEAKALSGHTMHITSIGRHIATDNYTHHNATVPTVAPAIITRAEADENYIYVDWTAPLNEWAFRRSVVYIGEIDPYDPYSPSLVTAKARASAYVYDLVLQKVRFRLLPPGTYYLRIMRENLNGMRVISEVEEIIVP